MTPIDPDIPLHPFSFGTLFSSQENTPEFCENSAPSVPRVRQLFLAAGDEGGQLLFHRLRPHGLRFQLTRKGGIFSLFVLKDTLNIVFHI